MEQSAYSPGLQGWQPREGDLWITEEIGLLTSSCISLRGKEKVPADTEMPSAVSRKTSPTSVINKTVRSQTFHGLTCASCFCTPLWVDVLLCAFSEPPSGPAGCRKQRYSVTDLLRWTRLTALQLGQYVCWVSTCLPTGVVGMGPEVWMGRGGW